MKKLLALVLSLVMLCSVFAVASAENGEKITIRVTWWGEVSENDAEMMMIKKFNAEHDDIEVIPEVVPGDGYGDRLLTSFASGEGPDLYQAQGHDHGQEEGEPSASPFFQGHGFARESFVCHHFVLLSTFEHWEDRNTGGRAGLAHRAP